MLKMHPAARKNIEEKAEELRSRARELIKKESPPAFATEIITKEITEEDMVGDLSECSTDYKGRVIGRYFRLNGKRIGLEGEDYRLLLDLSNQILRLPAARGKIDGSYTEQKIFEWVKIRSVDASVDVEFVQFFEDKVLGDLRKIVVHVPLAQAVVEDSFEFCGAHFENLSKEYFDKMLNVPEEYRNDPIIVSSTMKVREEFQGFAAIKFELECVPEFAFTTAIEQAKAITELFSIFSPAILSVDTKSVIKIRGTELIEQATAFFVDERGGRTSRSAVLDTASMNLIKILKADVARHRQFGMEVLSRLYKADVLSDFESAILSMSYLYSKSAFSDSPMEKLVYVLSALESTLLKSSSEPIQQNLAERLSICIKSNLLERKDVIKTLRSVYALRSNYLHHGNSSEELEQISKFLVNAWEFFVFLTLNSKTFQTRADFLSHIDDLKLSGSSGVKVKRSYQWK